MSIHASDPVDSRWDKVEYITPPIQVAHNVCLANGGITEEERIALYNMYLVRGESCVTEKISDRYIERGEGERERSDEGGKRLNCTSRFPLRLLRFNVKVVSSFDNLPRDYTRVPGSSIFLGCEIRPPIY